MLDFILLKNKVLSSKEFHLQDTGELTTLTGLLLEYADSSTHGLEVSLQEQCSSVHQTLHLRESTVNLTIYSSKQLWISTATLLQQHPSTNETII